MESASASSQALIAPGLAPALRVAVAAVLQQDRAVSGTDVLMGVDETAYLDKIIACAELFTTMDSGTLTGFIAFYCNDAASRTAFITLVLVAPRARGAGLGRRLVTHVFEVARRRGFLACELEVLPANTSALTLYHALGFDIVGWRTGKHVMRARLDDPVTLPA